MKRWTWVISGLAMPLAAVMVIAAGPRQSPAPASPQIIDNTTFFDANNLLMFVGNTGSFAYDRTALLGKNDGLYYPKGTNTSVIYAAGVWMGAKVNGGVRTAAAEYANDYVPGPMANGTFQSDRGSYRVYVINKGDTRETSEDYRTWPFDDGAPALKAADGSDSLDSEGNRIPLLLGDQALWSVYNDASVAGRESDPGSGSAGPLGVEIQHYVFGYARAGALGNTIFMQFKIINKGGNLLEDTYISLWADPDLGDAGDDFVGCDTTLSIGFCYNADADDASYGDKPPAVGFDFFQGPIIPAPGVTDTILVDGKVKVVTGYEELPMTSFNKYINGTDPSNNIETYNYMQGLEINGTPHVYNGDTVKFFMSGDPVTGTGELDNNAADRRYMMTSGPFTMNPGDTQVVVAAVIVAQGDNHLSSVQRLRETDRIAQNVFDANFDIPGPPPPPTVWQIPHDNAVRLFWGVEADGDVQESYGPPVEPGGEPVLLQRFVHEGFNVYQGASSSGPWTKIATFDLNNDVERIYNDVDNPEGRERVVVQHGSNTGLQHELLVVQDRIRGGGIVNNRPYYFAVTAYNYDELNAVPFTDELGNPFGIIAESFETLPSAPSDGVVPLSMTGILADTAEHLSGISDGTVLIDFYDPTAVTGHTYNVTFNEDLSWNLLDVDDDEFLLQNETFPISSEGTDGFILRVLGPSAGIKSIVEVANANGPVDPPDNVAFSRNSTGDWYISSDDGNNWARLNWRGLIGVSDWEFRFTSEGSEYYDWSTDEKWPNRAPFEVWNIGPGTINNTADDRRVQFAVLDDDESGGWSMGDRIYVIEREYVEPLPATAVYDFPADFHIGRIIINDLSGNGPCAEGTIIRFTTNKPNAPEDLFEFVTHVPGDGDGTVIKNAVDNVYPVPNPYYNLTSLELDQFRRQIKFVNLPPALTTIRIFNLAGDCVRVLTKDNPGSAELVWDVLTETGLPVASGMYIYHVEAEGIGTKIGKLAVFTEVEQLNTY
ncbi:MAG TPA: hypothetical protein VNN55_05910 [bacterium]|nr:hypothetical protein [bacterium]